MVRVSAPVLLILTGPPGAGKTTVAPLVAARRSPSIVVEADAYWAWVVSGAVNPWRAEAADQNRTLISAVMASATRLVNDGFTTVVAGVLGPWHLDVIDRELEGCRARVQYVILRPSLACCLQRAGVRRADPRHRGALAESGPIRLIYQEYQQLGDFERMVLDTTELSLESTVSRVASTLDDPRYTLQPALR
ncbi:MAG: AAA family ATPase [Acidimicrobiales bacterium]